ncbi:unnamed protein product, partial [marine sediment metagenome]
AGIGDCPGDEFCYMYIYVFNCFSVDWWIEIWEEEEEGEEEG